MTLSPNKISEKMSLSAKYTQELNDMYRKRDMDDTQGWP